MNTWGMYNMFLSVKWFYKDEWEKNKEAVNVKLMKRWGESDIWE